MPVEAAGPQDLDGLADLAVHGRPADRAQLAVDGLPDQVVGNAVAADQARVLGDEAAGQHLLQGLDELVVGAAEQPAEQLGVELAADHGGVGEQVVGSAREAVAGPADDLAHGRGDAGPAQLLGRVQAALGLEQPDQLADEERVALGPGVDGRGQRPGGTPVAASMNRATSGASSPWRVTREVTRSRDSEASTSLRGGAGPPRRRGRRRGRAPGCRGAGG